MGQSNKFKGIGGFRLFNKVAFSYGMTEDDAEEVLQKEFSRRHKGAKFSSYVLKWT